MNYTVLITERENIINPETKKVYEDDKALEALNGIVRTRVNVEAEDEQSAMLDALEVYEEKFRTSELAAEIISYNQ